MGNIKSQTRGMDASRGGTSVEHDPFAELAEIFESELQFDQRFSGDAVRRQPVASRHAPEDGFDAMDREFQAAFATEVDRAPPARDRAMPVTPSYQTSYQNWVAPKGEPRAERAPAAVRLRKVAEPKPTRLTDEEIDGELESVLRGLSAPAKPRDRIIVETQSFAPERAIEERAPDAQSFEVDEFEELIRSELAVIRPNVAAASSAHRRTDRAAEPVLDVEGGGDFGHASNAGYEDEVYSSGPAYAARRPIRPTNWRRGLALGASTAALLLVCGIGYAVWPNGSANVAGSDEPLLIKADAEPYKVAPKDPGGRAYPNQNKAVYDRVMSPNKNQDTPMQQALLKNTEEPMDLPADDESTYAEGLPGVELGDGASYGMKDETRVAAAATSPAEATEPALQPRKVKTMVVGSDGRLVLAAQGSSSASAPAKPASELRMASADADGALADAARAEMPMSKPAAPADTKRQAADPVEVAAVAPPKKPEPVAAPDKPATTDAVLASKPDAAAVPQAAPAGSYFVQISSQPTEAAAQQSMASLGKRYASVLDGRSVGIQSAEISGKGTYYRVRVATSSKDEAASICTRLKSAGATCFVSR